MKHLVFIFCLVGTAFGQANRQIINGVSVGINSHSYMASIHTNAVFTCGGAIINYRSVLTAAHCILSYPQDITVCVGSARNNGQDGLTIRAAATFTHPDYRGTDRAIVSDIAVIRTARPISYSSRVRPIPLGSSATVSANERVTITGWGLTRNSPNSEVSENLQAVELVTISNSVCTTLHQSTIARGWITNEKMCATGIQNVQQNSGICDGDSGSPLVLRGAVIGVASWTIRPCASLPSVFIRTSNHLPWIRANL